MTSAGRIWRTHRALSPGQGVRSGIKEKQEFPIFWWDGSSGDFSFGFKCLFNGPFLFPSTLMFLTGAEAEELKSHRLPAFIIGWAHRLTVRISAAAIKMRSSQVY